MPRLPLRSAAGRASREKRFGRSSPSCARQPGDAAVVGAARVGPRQRVPERESRRVCHVRGRKGAIRRRRRGHHLRQDYQERDPGKDCLRGRHGPGVSRREPPSADARPRHSQEAHQRHLRRDRRGRGAARSPDAHGEEGATPVSRGQTIPHAHLCRSRILSASARATGSSSTTGSTARRASTTSTSTSSAVGRCSGRRDEATGKSGLELGRALVALAFPHL